MAAILNNLQEGDVLFIDEIHRLNRQWKKCFYPAMEDFAIDIMIGKGAAARSIRLDLPKFTLIGATTRAACSLLRCVTGSESSIIWNIIRKKNSRRSSCVLQICSE